MNAEQLLAHYERVADAPDALERLRRLVLDLAVRGKLVPQYTNDRCPRNELAAARTWLAQEAQKTGRVRWKASEDFSADAESKSLPHGWVTARVNDTGLYINGLAFKPADWKSEGLPIIRIQNLTDSSKEFNYAQGDYPDEVIVRDGDILVSWSATLEAFRWTRGRGVLNQHIFRVIPAPGLTTDAYLLLLLRNAIREMADSEHAHGLVMTHINRGPFTAHLVHIPPLAEQHRIVAKVEELMVLCDRLEAARAQRETTRDRLTASTLARLNTPEPPASPDGDTPKESSFQSDARFALKVLPALTTRPDQIKRLRQTILNLAVRGRLVAQKAIDSSAINLLRDIYAEKTSFAKAGAISKPKEIARDPKWQPEYIPARWSTAALGDVCSIITSGSRGWAEFYSEAGPAFIRAQNIRFGQLRLDGLARVNPPKGSEGSRTQVAKGDLLIVITGAGVTNPGLLETDIGDAYVSQHVALVRPVRTQLSAWLLLCLMAEQGGRGELVERAYGAGKPGLNLDNLRCLTILLPPLAEQNRIVAKVDELMSLCDQLEASLTRGENTRSRLLNALLHEALQPGHDNVIDFEAARQRLLEKRQAVACRIVERLSRTKGFGRVRAVKPLYFAEAHCGVALGGRWGRGDFGPYDHWIRSFESQAVAAGWLTFVERQTPDGNTRVEYTPGSQLPSKAQAAAQALGNSAAEFERVLALLAALDTPESEIVATLYAAWNDLLIEKKLVSDDLVISEFREHWGAARKADFDALRLRKWLEWMRKNHLTPKGLGPNTRHQPELI